MPRKRIIDPEFWSDQEIGFWSDKAKLFYIGLWNFADDEGRLKAHSSLLKSQIFPYELKVDMEKLKLDISDKVQWYEVNGIKYGFIRNFLKHQRIDRPTKSKLPPPPQLGEDSTRLLGGLLPNISKEKISKENEKRIEKDLYLEAVLLTKEEYAKLVQRFGTDGTNKRIETLNNGICSKGYKYKSHYHTILNWAAKDEKRANTIPEVSKRLL